MHLSPHPYVLHAPPTSFFSIWSPEWYLVISTDHLHRSEYFKLRKINMSAFPAYRVWDLKYDNCKLAYRWTMPAVAKHVNVCNNSGVMFLSFVTPLCETTVRMLVE
jgi:hypothetical protein